MMQSPLHAEPYWSMPLNLASSPVTGVRPPPTR